MSSMNLVTPGAHEMTDVSLVEIPALSDLAKEGNPLFAGRLDLVSGVKVRVRAVIGDGEMSVAELFSLKDGSIVPLQCDVHPLVDIQLDNRTIAHGELVVVDDALAVRITAIVHELA